MQAADYCVLPLVKRAHRGHPGWQCGETLVDADDCEMLRQWTWTLDKGGYAVRAQYVLGSGKAHPKRVTFRIHRVVMGLAPKIKDDPRQVDHINGNRLDNRKTNLRIVTHAEQAQNRTYFKRGSSRFRGVHWHPEVGRWCARVSVRRKPYHLGYFDNEIDAALAAHVARLGLLPLAESDPFLVELGLIDGRV